MGEVKLKHEVMAHRNCNCDNGKSKNEKWLKKFAIINSNTALLEFIFILKFMKTVFCLDYH